MADQTPVKANLTSGNATSLAQYATGDTIPVANGGLGSTGITGIVKGSGTAYSAATAGTDYAAATTGTNAQLLANNGSGGFSNVTVGSGLNLTTGTLTAPSTMTYPGAGIANSTGTAWGTSYTTSGTGTVVALATSPSFTTPVLGTPSSGTLTSCTGLPIATGVSGLGTNVATFLATPSSANLAAALTDETGSGSAVFATSPTLVTPILGTPQSGTLTSCTGLPISTGVSGLGTNVATFLATPSSANLASALTDKTGSGANVFATSPTLVTPTLGVASATTVNKVTLTAPATGSTLTIADGKTLTASNTVTLTGTDSTSYNLDALTTIPQNTQSISYTLVLSDAGKAVVETGTTTTLTIPANGTVAYPVGTSLTFVNNTAGNISIAITTDTMYLAGSATTGTRTLAQRGVATAYKVTSTVWFIAGGGLT